MDEFLIELQAKLDEAKSKGNINADIGTLQGQIDKLKIQAEIDPKTAQKLASDIGKLVNQKITISNIEVDTTQAVKSAQKTGQQIKEVISDAAGKAINNVSSKNIGKYFKVTSSDSKQFQNEMEKLVNGWTNGKGKVKDINIQTRTSYDKQSGQNIERLHQALVTYENELNEVIKKTIAWRQIGTKTNSNGKEEAIHGFVEVAGQYSKSLDVVTAKTDNFAKKQKRMLSNKQNTINQITSNAFDKNASSPITSEESLDKLNAQADKIRTAMDSLRNSTAETFDDAVLKVNEEISSFKILEKELRRADNVSDKMKGTDTSSGISIAKNRLEKFKSDAKEFPQIKKTIEDLDAAFSNVGDAESLNKFNDQLKVAKAELERVKTETSATLKELEKSYQHINDLQIKKSTLDPTADKNKISNLNDEIIKAQNEYNAIFDSASRSNNFDIGKWEETKKAIDSATKSKIEFNNAGKADSLENTKNGLASTLSNLKSSLQENGAYTDELKGKIKSLETELANISNEDGLSAFKSSFKEVSAEAEKMVSKAEQAKKILERIDKAVISNKYENVSSKITDNYNSIDTSLIDKSLKNDYNELIRLSNELNISMSDDDKINTYNRLEELIPSIKSRLAELKSPQSQLDIVNNIQGLVNGAAKNDYLTQIAKIGGNFRSIGFSQEEVDTKLKDVSDAFDALKKRLSQPFDKNNFQEIISLNDKLQRALNETSNEYVKLQASSKGYVSIHQRLTKANIIEAWNQKNTKATKEAIATNQAYIDSLRDLNVQMTQMKYDEISRGFKENENSMRGINRLGASLKSQFAEAAQGFSQWMSVSSGVMFAVSKTKDAITEIKNLDDILTEVSKTSDLTAKELKQLRLGSFDTASKYGRTASDYLSGVQSMSQSGFYGEIGEAMAEQSLLAQSAGDMTQEVADKYIIATNAAYKFNGEASKINGVLDGQNSINKIVALYRNI